MLIPLHTLPPKSLHTFSSIWGNTTLNKYKRWGQGKKGRTSNLKNISLLSPWHSVRMPMYFNKMGRRKKFQTKISTFYYNKKCWLLQQCVSPKGAVFMKWITWNVRDLKVQAACRTAIFGWRYMTATSERLRTYFSTNPTFKNLLLIQ